MKSIEKGKVFTWKRTAVLTVVTGALLAGTAAAPATAVTTSRFTETGLTTSISGNIVTTKLSVKASANTRVDVISVCARDSNNRDVDFPGSRNVTVAKTGTTITKQQSLPNGDYKVFGCIQYQGTWYDTGAQKTITVGKAATTPVTNKLPVGNLPGWNQVLAEDFNTPHTAGTDFTNYNGQWMSYNGFKDTFGNGQYDQSILSVKDGALNAYLHTENGQPRVAAPVPLVNGQWGGQQYGRFSVRMKSDPLPGYKTAFLLWSDDNNWNHGEIDFPEGGLNGNVQGYNHCVNNPQQNCMVVETGAKYADWHTYTIDWTPKKLTYYVDGVVVGSTTESVPTSKMHWVMQIETENGIVPASSTAGNLSIDWATIYTYNPATVK